MQVKGASKKICKNFLILNAFLDLLQSKYKKNYWKISN